jgi:hypothetical protein
MSFFCCRGVIPDAALVGRGSRSGLRIGGNTVTTTWYVLPSRAITKVGSGVEIFNNSDYDAHVELTTSGELLVKRHSAGQLIIQFTEES